MDDRFACRGLRKKGGGDLPEGHFSNSTRSGLSPPDPSLRYSSGAPCSPAYRAAPNRAVLSFKMAWTGIERTSGFSLPLAVKDFMNAGSFSLGRIFGAMPPPMNTLPVANTLSARFPASAPRIDTKQVQRSNAQLRTAFQRNRGDDGGGVLGLDPAGQPRGPLRPARLAEELINSVEAGAGKDGLVTDVLQVGEEELEESDFELIAGR